MMLTFQALPFARAKEELWVKEVCHWWQWYSNQCENMTKLGDHERETVIDFIKIEGTMLKCKFLLKRLMGSYVSRGKPRTQVWINQNSHTIAAMGSTGASLIPKQHSTVDNKKGQLLVPSGLKFSEQRENSVFPWTSCVSPCHNKRCCYLIEFNVMLHSTGFDCIQYSQCAESINISSVFS